MQIFLAKETGFCFGVKRAVKIAEQALKELKGIRSLGPIVHNRQVVSHLESQGLKGVESLAEAGEEPVFIPSHGVGQEVLKELEERGLKVIDATCPVVRRAQKVSERLHREDFQVLVFGEAHHSEVQGIISWAGGEAIAALKAPQISPPPRRLGVLSQTTQSLAGFNQFLAELLYSNLALLTELHIFNTICEATSKRQEAALELAGKVDQMIVIGGYNSANTNRLAELCSSVIPTWHIESAAELKPENLKAERIGVTAGASTPDRVIQEVVEKLKGLA